MRINNQNNNSNFKALSPLMKPLGQFYNTNATLPTLVIETGVTLGRAHEANKRGGIPEAVDRLVEQGISAVVWIYGVKILKNMGDFIGKKITKIEDFNFDIGFDELRNPTKYIDKKALTFKAANILTSTAIATYFIGAILPKINNAILNKILKKQEKMEVNKEETTLKSVSFDEFKNKTSKKDISFTSLTNFANLLENNSAARLLITDTGVIAGRFYNAPNKYRKIEGLFRDIASIYFYLKAPEHIVKGLNILTSNSNINPKAIEKTVEMLSAKIQDNPNMTNETFLNCATKEPNPKHIKQLKELFANKKTISVDEFLKVFPESKIKAEQMAKMQFIESGNGILSFQQASDVLSDSWTSNPEFLKKTMDYALDKDISDKLCFVSSKDLNKIRGSIDAFVKQICNRANKDGCKIDKEYILKIAKRNMRNNFIYNILGTAFSIYALGTLIPKVQYAITKKMTNENKFHVEKE